MACEAVSLGFRAVLVQVWVFPASCHALEDLHHGFGGSNPRSQAGALTLGRCLGMWRVLSLLVNYFKEFYPRGSRQNAGGGWGQRSPCLAAASARVGVTNEPRLLRVLKEWLQHFSSFLWGS